MATKRKSNKRKPPKLPGGGKTFVNVQNQVNERTLEIHRLFARQFAEDAAILAVHETFGAGEKRIAEFLDCFYQTINEMSDMTLEDSKDDKACVYSHEKLDEALKKCMGVNFKPYEERYRF